MGDFRSFSVVFLEVIDWLPNVKARFRWNLSVASEYSDLCPL